MHSYRKSMVRTLGSTKSRFLAIFAIVALGVGFLAGLMATPADMTQSMEEYLDSANLYDLRIVSTLGLTDADAEALRAVDGVQTVQPAFSADLLVQSGSTDVIAARAHSLPENADGDPEAGDTVNRLRLVEGRWPQSPGECVVEAGTNSMARGFALGDTFTATAANDALEEKLCVTQYTIVGIVRGAYYFSYEREPASVGNGTVSVVFYLQPSDFSYEAYTELYVTAENALTMNSLGDEYTQWIKTVSDAVSDISEARCAARYEEITADARAELDDAWQEYRDAEAQADAELNDALAEIEDGRQQLLEAEDEILRGEQEYADGLDALTENVRLLRDAQTQLDAARDQLTEGQADYEDGMRRMEDAQAALNAGRLQLEEGQRQYEEGLAACRAALVQLESGEAQLAASRTQLEEGQAALDAGTAALEAQRPQLEAAQAQLDSLRQLADGEAAYAAGTAQLAQSLTASGLAVTQEQMDGYLRTLAAQEDGALPRSDAALVLELMLFLRAATPESALPAADGTALSDAAAELAAARRSLDAGRQAVVDSGAAADDAAVSALLAEESLAALQQQIDEGNARLAAGQAELDAAGKELADGWAQLQAGEAALREGRAALEETIPQLEDARVQLEAGWAEYNAQGEALYGALNTLRSAGQTLDSGWAALTDRQLALDDAVQQITDARRTLADAHTALEDARQTLAEKKQELADGETEYADAKAEVAQELADAKAEIEDGEAALAEVSVPEWYVWDRTDNVSFHSFQTNVAKLQALTTIFPVFFFLVAALVVSTTMTRMVEEERLQIGTLKALGYTSGSIMAKYLFYALAASLAGTVFGLAVGFVAFPRVIWSAYEMMYWMPTIRTPWRWSLALASGGLLVGGAAVVTLFTCRTTLREDPAALLRPRAPRAGKRILLERIGFVWRRLPFSYKVTCRNLLRYKKRFWMTVVGVAGCTTLLVAGFGISDSLNSIITRQYGDVYLYQLLTIVTDEEAAQSGEVYEYLFGGGVFSESLAVSMEKAMQDTADGTAESYFLIPRDTAAFADFADLHERVSGTPTPLGETGVVLTEKLANALGVRAGDTVTLANSSGDTADFCVTGVCEHYVSNYIYLSAAAYTAGYGSAPAFNAVLSLMPDDSQTVRDAASAALLGMDGVASLSFTQDNITTVLNMLTSIDAVVVLIIVCAAGLAFVVLYNLSNINIAERVKEIATIKVLGFHDREVDAYVNRESVSLTVIGALFGLFGGTALHHFVIQTVEVDAVMFGRDIRPASYLYAFALTLLFGLAVSLVMGRRLKAISMVESMKAPE